MKLYTALHDFAIYFMSKILKYFDFIDHSGGRMDSKKSNRG